MNTQEAYKILGVTPGATETERHEAFAAKRQRLADKMAKAPTPGLAQKYRDSLAQLEQAIEVIEMAEDDGDLPLLSPQQAAPAKPTVQQAVSPKAPAKKKSSAAKEITIAAILVLLLCGGAAGWWFGLENPKRVEADRLVELAVALEADGEWGDAKSHYEQALAQKPAWPSAVEGLSRAETELSRMEAEFARSEQERLRDTDRALVQARVAEGEEQWSEALSGYQNAFKLSPGNVEAEEGVARLEKLLEHARGTVVVKTEPGAAIVRLSNNGEEMSPATFKALKLGIYDLEIEKSGYDPVMQTVSVKKDKTVVAGPIRLSRSKGVVLIETNPNGMDYRIEQTRSDVPGEKPFDTRQGHTPAVISDLPTGDYEVMVEQAPLVKSVHPVTVLRDRKETVRYEIQMGDVELRSKPTGAMVQVNGHNIGLTPLELQAPVGQHTVLLSYEGLASEEHVIDVATGETTQVAISFDYATVSLAGSPKGATVLLRKDGVELRAELPVSNWVLPSGEYETEISHGDDYAVEQFTLDLSQHAVEHRDVELKNWKMIILKGAVGRHLYKDLGALPASKGFKDKRYEGYMEIQFVAENKYIEIDYDLRMHYQNSYNTTWHSEAKGFELLRVEGLKVVHMDDQKYNGPMIRIPLDGDYLHEEYQSCGIKALNGKGWLSLIPSEKRVGAGKVWGWNKQIAVSFSKYEIINCREDPRPKDLVRYFEFR